MKRFSPLALLLFGCATSSAPVAENPDPPPSDSPPSDPVRVHVRADVDRIGAGQEVRLAFDFDVSPGYFVSWTDSGTDEPGTSVRVSTPSGFVISEPRFEGPKRLDEPAPIRYGYDAPFAASLVVSTPAALNAGETRLDASVSWTVCQRHCETRTKDITVSLATASPQAPSKPIHSDFFRIHDGKLPVPWSQLSNARHSWLRTKTGHELVLYIDGAVSAEYMPHSALAPKLIGQAVVPGSGVAALHLSYSGEVPGPVTGVVRASDATDTYYFDLGVPGPPAGCTEGTVCRPSKEP